MNLKEFLIKERDIGNERIHNASAPIPLKQGLKQYKRCCGCEFTQIKGE